MSLKNVLDILIEYINALKEHFIFLEYSEFSEFSFLVEKLKVFENLIKLH